MKIIEPTGDSDDRPRTTGRSLVLIRKPLPLKKATSILHRLTPPSVPPCAMEEIHVLPNEWILASINAPRDHLLAPPLLWDLLQRVIIEPERRLYHYIVDDTGEPCEVEPGWHITACGITDSSPTGKGVSVAVLDSGFDRSHPDFHCKVRDEDFQTFIGGSADDSDDHGTHCAGIIGGPKTSTSGYRYGVAPDARLIIGRVSTDTASSTWELDVIAGMLWAHARGADIISFSLGLTQRTCDPTSPIFEFITSVLLRAGTIIVGAVGNSSKRIDDIRQPIHHPVDSREMLAVAALEPDFSVWDRSCPSVCNQRNPSIAAPGRKIYSAVPVGTDTTNHPFRPKTGTSSATPLAAGIAALWAEKTGARGLELFKLLHDHRNLTRLQGLPEDVGSGLLRSP